VQAADARKDVQQVAAAGAGEVAGLLAIEGGPKGAVLWPSASVAADAAGARYIAVESPASSGVSTECSG